MAIKRYRYCVSNITQNGQACTNPSYQWDVPACASNPCEEGNCIEVELDLDTDPDCRSISVTIDCDDCAKCPPVKQTVTFCDSNEDCEACAICEDNVCVYQCATDEFCDSGDCVDCLVDGDCPYNKVCVAGDCLCPPGLVEDIYGNCVECVNDGQCDACEKCNGGACEPKCPDNLCLDGGCKECLVDGDCTGANVCCGADNTCECCPGYRWDPATDTCVPETECISNSDCGACEYCNTGSCQPISCPAGMIVSNIPGNCCVDECDCNAPDCEGNSICVPLDSSTCYCNECQGSCDDNGDCGEGCYCNGTSCVPNPCYGTCEGAGDCGPGCGCLAGECVPCSSGDCADNSCSEIKGCECDGGDCQASPCKADCTFDECGEGCGCQDNNCVSCESVSCVDNDDCPYGCGCDGGICRDSGCAEVVCNTPADCGEGCGCDDGICRPCSTYSCSDCASVPGCTCVNGLCEDDDDDTCQDQLGIAKDEANCDLILSLQTEACCGCGDIQLRTAFSSLNHAGTDSTFNVLFSLFKNGVAINATGVANELSYFAADLPSVVLKTHYIYKEAEDFGSGFVIKAGAPALEGNYTSTIPFTATGVSASTAASIKKVDAVFAASGKNYKVIKTYVTIELAAGDVVKTGDSCEYDLEQTKLYETTSTFTPSGTYNTAMVQETTCATPQFIFTKSNSSTFPVGAGTTSTKYYADPDTDGDGIWKYILEDYTGDGLENFKYYKLSSPCSCAGEFKYGCDGSGTVAEKLVFCALKTLGEVTFDDCASEVTFVDGVYIDCDVAEQSPTAPTFDLYINGEIHTAGITPAAGEIIAPATSYVTTNGQITSVKLVMKNTVCDDCYLEKTNVPVLDACDATCYDVSALSIDAISVVNACTTGTVITVSGGFGATKGDLYEGAYLGLPPSIVTPIEEDVDLTGLTNLVDGDYTIVVYDELGCKAADTFTVSGCCDLVVNTVSHACTVNDAEFDLTVNIAGTSTYSVKVINNTTSLITTVVASDTAANINAGSPYTVSSAPNGSYTVLIEDTGVGAIDACSEQTVISVNCCLDAFTATWNPVTGEVDFEKGGVAYTGPIKVYNGGSLIYDGAANLIDHGATWVEGQTYAIIFNDPSGCTGSDSVAIIPCSVTSTTPTVSCDVDSYTFTFTSIGGSNSGAFNFTATAGAVSTAAPVAMTDLGGGSFSVVLTIGAEIPSEFVSTPITYTITDSVNSSCSKTATVSTPTDCAGDVLVSYSCTDGIVVTEGGAPYVGSIIIDGGSPIAYASGIFLTDGNHTVKVGGTTFPVNGINCCASLVVSADATSCDGAGLYVDWSVSGGSGSYNVTFKDTLGNTVATAVAGAAAGSYTASLSGIGDGGTVVIQATDANYNYTQGIGAPDTCTDSDSIVVDVCDSAPPTITGYPCDGTLLNLAIAVDLPECGISSITSVRYGQPDVPVLTATPEAVTTWYAAPLSGGAYLADLSVFVLCSCGPLTNSWSVPNGLIIEINYTQGSCGSNTEYVYLPANTGPIGCEACTGFNCEV